MTGNRFEKLYFPGIRNNYYRINSSRITYTGALKILQCSCDDINEARRAVWPFIRKPSEIVVNDIPKQIFELEFSGNNDIYLGNAVEQFTKTFDFFSTTKLAKLAANCNVRTNLANQLIEHENRAMKKNKKLQDESTAYNVELYDDVNTYEFNANFDIY